MATKNVRDRPKQREAPEASACPKPVLVIINGRLPRARVQALATGLKSRGTDFAYTTYSGHAIEIARQATSYRTLVAAGGDGTVSEIATGMDASAHYLAIIPAGTRNCIARALGLRNVDAGLSALASGYAANIDVMETVFMDSRMKHMMRRFLSYAACGLEADAARRAREGKKLPRFVQGMCSTLAAAVRLRPFGVRLSVNDDAESEVTLSSLLISNCGCKELPCVLPWNLCDGAAEALMIRRSALGQALRCMGGLPFFSRSRHWRPGITKLASKFSTPVVMAGDGEIFTGITAMAMAIAAQKLRVIAPGAGPFTHPKLRGKN